MELFVTTAAAESSAPAAAASGAAAAAARREVRAASDDDGETTNTASKSDSPDYDDNDESWYYERQEEEEDADDERVEPAWLSSDEPLQIVRAGLLHILDGALQCVARERCDACQNASASADQEQRVNREPVVARDHMCFRGLPFQYVFRRCFNTLVPRVLTPDLVPRLRRYLKLHPCVPALGDASLLAVVVTMLHALKWDESIYDTIFYAYTHLTLVELAALDKEA